MAMWHLQATLVVLSSKYSTLPPHNHPTSYKGVHSWHIHPIPYCTVIELEIASCGSHSAPYMYIATEFISHKPVSRTNMRSFNFDQSYGRSIARAMHKVELHSIQGNTVCHCIRSPMWLSHDCHARALIYKEVIRLSGNAQSYMHIHAWELE